MDHNANAFGAYYNENYVKNKKKKVLLWTGCFSSGTLANTNMYAESLHSNLCIVSNSKIKGWTS